MEINTLRGMYDDFVKIISECVIKYNKLANNKQETLEVTKSAEQYITAIRNEDHFLSYMVYDRDLLLSVGIPNDDKLLNYYMENRRNIPYEYRDRLLELKRKRVISTYIEKNDYYRCMSGLPNLDDEEFFYCSDELSDEYSIDKTIPIHKLGIYQLTILEERGYISKLIEENPTKEYLKYLGNNSINIVDARTALNFALLRLPRNVKELMQSNFSILYEQCREYFMSTIYVTEYTTMYEYYDNFIAMCIMVMTIQQVIARSLKNNIDREFYDDYLVKLLYESYNVPYLEHLDDISQKAIVQNLNMLIQYKSTDKVLYDIAGLLGFDRVKIYKYYLMRVQKFDMLDNLPVEATKTIVNEYGETVKVPDYEAMYDIYFQKVELKERDYHKALQNDRNKTSYLELTQPDPFWIEDDELYKALYEEEYNFKETKYLSMNISYRLSEVMFETVYLIRMLFDKKTEISAITLQLPRILGAKEVNLFTTVVALSAMLCKKNNLRGEILYSPSQILHVLNFNFKQDFDVLRQHIHDDPYLSNDMLVYLQNMTAYTIESVNNLYINIKDLRDFISEKLASSSNIEEYRAYDKLYRTLYISEENKEMFVINRDKDNPEYAETYLEYLHHHHLELYNFINDMEAEKLSPYVDHIIVKMTEIIPTIKYLYVANDASNMIAEALLTLIRFFKSYTTEMIGLNVVYIFDSKPLHMLKLIDTVHYIHKIIQTGANIPLAHSDVIDKIIIHLQQNDFLKLNDKIHLISNIRYDDLLFGGDEIHYIHKVINANDKQRLYDTLEMYKVLEISNELLNLRDNVRILKWLYMNDALSLKDAILITSIIYHDEKLLTYDNIEKMDKALDIREFLIINDVVKLHVLYTLFDKLLLRDNSLLTKEIGMNERMNLFDTIGHIIDTIFTQEDFKINDKVFIQYTIMLSEKFLLKDVIYEIFAKILTGSNLNLYDTADVKSKSNILPEILPMKEVLHMKKVLSYLMEQSVLKDMVSLISNIYHNEKLPIYDSVGHMVIDIMEKCPLNLKDSTEYKCVLTLFDILSMYDKVLINAHLWANDKISIYEAISHITSSPILVSPLILKDALSLIQTTQVYNLFTLNDKCTVITKYYHNEPLHLYDEILIGKESILPSNIVMKDNIQYDITTYMNDKYKLMDKGHIISKHYKDDIALLYSNIEQIMTNLFSNENVKFVEKIYLSCAKYALDKYGLKDIINLIGTIDISTKRMYSDTIRHINKYIQCDNVITLKSKVSEIEALLSKNIYTHLEDAVREVIVSIITNNFSHFLDNISYINSKLNNNELVKLNEELTFYSICSYVHNLMVRDTIHRISNFYHNDITIYYDIMNDMKKSVSIHKKMSFSDRIIILE